MVSPVIHPHLNFESLLEGFLAGVGEGVPGRPRLRPVIVPSLPFSDFLQLRMAAKRGVCMGWEFLMTQDFVASVTQSRGGGAWRPRALCWRVLPHISGCADKLGVGNPNLRDRFALARLIADRFDQYGHFRPEIFRAWEAGKTLGLESEDWQRELWMKLRKETPEAPAALEFARLREDAGFRARLKVRFPEVFVLGSVDPLLVDVLGLLADCGSHVEAHVILPSLEYLGDLHKKHHLPKEETDLESFDLPGGHPLVQSMGRQAVGAFTLLAKLDEQFTHWPDAGEGHRTTLLGCLQADIQTLQVGTCRADDLSLRVHSCHGPRREIETLRDELLRAFQDLPGLRPDEVRVVAPSLEIYEPLFSSILGSHFPVRAAAATEPVAEAILEMLAITMRGRFEASEILDLLDLRGVQTALGIADDERAFEQFRRAVRESGLTHGLEEPNPGSWPFARDRLIAGRWLGCDAIYPDNNFVLPVSDALGSAVGDKFLEWHFRLAATLREWLKPSTPSGWADRLAGAARDLSETDMVLRAPIEFLRGVANGDLVDAGTICDWLSGEVAEPWQRVPASGNITIGKFNQLRHLPCRVLAMIGMKDFPAQNTSPSWDLLPKMPRIWDRNPRVDDRQLFLDALLTPTERLIITSPNRNVRTNATEPLSVCVDELLRVCHSMGADSLVVGHRIQPFSAEYFLPESRLPHSFDTVHAEVARALRESASPRPFWMGGQDDIEKHSVSLRDLVRFWKDPAGAFLQARGIVLPREMEDDAALNRSPLSLDSLTSWAVKDAIVCERVFGGGGLSFTKERLRADRQLPPGACGDQVWHALSKPAQELAELLNEHLGEKRGITVHVGEIEVSAELLLAKDGEHLLAYRTGKIARPSQFLEPWIQAILASAHGLEMPTFVLDESAELRELPAVSSSGAHLGAILDGFWQGQQRPLCFAPSTSHACARKLALSQDEAISAAQGEWYKEGWGGDGEGLKDAAKLVWRGRNPFEDASSWIHWARAVSEPLRAWGGLP